MNANRKPKRKAQLPTPEQAAANRAESEAVIRHMLTTVPCQRCAGSKAHYVVRPKSGITVDLAALFQEQAWKPSFVPMYMRNMLQLCKQCAAEYQPRDYTVAVETKLRGVAARMHMARSVQERRHWGKILTKMKASWLRTQSEIKALAEYADYYARSAGTPGADQPRVVVPLPSEKPAEELAVASPMPQMILPERDEEPRRRVGRPRKNESED